MFGFFDTGYDEQQYPNDGFIKKWNHKTKKLEDELIPIKYVDIEAFSEETAQPLEDLQVNSSNKTIELKSVRRMTTLDKFIDEFGDEFEITNVEIEPDTNKYRKNIDRRYSVQRLFVE